jgi:hypothetical protein
MMVAIAITKGAIRIYSQDPDLKMFAHWQITVSPLPSLTRQQELFEGLINPVKEHNKGEDLPF